MPHGHVPTSKRGWASTRLTHETDLRASVHPHTVRPFAPYQEGSSASQSCRQNGRIPFPPLACALGPQFETMVVSGQIKELRCFYDNQKRVFYSVVELGK